MFILYIMAGGLFGEPFSINVKCIIFSFLCMALFLFKPDYSNKLMLYIYLGFIFIIAYVTMAWYDYIFNCDILPLKRGQFTLTSQFKPPIHEEKKQIEHQETVEENKLKKYLIYLTHILVIVPLLVYIAVYRKNINPVVYPLLGALAFLTLIYHGYSAINLAF